MKYFKITAEDWNTGSRILLVSICAKSQADAIRKARRHSYGRRIDYSTLEATR